MSNEELIQAIRSIKDNEELRPLWDAMKRQWDINTRREVDSYRPLDLVDVTFKDGTKYRARVDKVNKKSINVFLIEDPYKGKQYRVHPTYVTKVTQEMLDEIEFNSTFA